METTKQLSAIRNLVLVIGAVTLLVFLVRELNTERQTDIDKQIEMASQLGPGDVYDVNHIPFYVIGKTLTFTGGSQDGQQLRFDPSDGKTVTVDATPGTHFELFDTTFAVTKYDANTDIVHIKRLAEK